MIHLDTNILIALPTWARQGHPLIRRIAEGEPAAVCTMVWYEFLAGPLDDEEAGLARAFLQDRILPVTEADAELAAMLFNDTGRRRGLRTDALIAATAIRADAEFATINVEDFEVFRTHGLRLQALTTPGRHPSVHEA